MRTIGWEVPLSSEQYRCPPHCASCGGPQEESVEIGGSRRTGYRSYRVIRLLMPYCHACAARLRWSGRRMMALFGLVTVLSIALPALGHVLFLLQGGAPALVMTGDRAAILGAPAWIAAGGCAAFVLAAIAALVLVPREPRPPATARGEAVSLSRYDERGIALFCTNRSWAENLAAANRSSLRDASKLRLMGPGALAWSAVLALGVVFLFVSAAIKHRPAPLPATGTPAARSTPAVPGPHKHK